MSVKKPIARLKPASEAVVRPPSISLKPNEDINLMHQTLAIPSNPEASAAQHNEDIARFQPAPSNPSDLDVNRLTVGHTYEVPVTMLFAAKNNARVFYKPDEVDQMGISILKEGQKVAASGYVRDDKIWLVDGQKRFNACLMHKIATMKVSIESPPSSDVEEYETSRMINIERSAQTAFDDAVRWQHLLSDGLYTNQDEIAQRLKIHKSVVSKTLGLNRIPDAIKRQMIEFDCTANLNTAYEVSTIFSKATEENIDELTEIAETVVQTIQKKSLGYLQAMELVKTRMNGPKQRMRGKASEVRYGDYKGTILVTPAKGAFVMSFTGLKGDDLERLQAAATSILEQ